ncbi:MAG: head-tail adaptor protein [Pseudomonadota bacterium]
MSSANRRTSEVIIQQYTSVDDRFGDKKAWTEFRRVWVGIDPNRGSESFVSGERRATVVYAIRGDFLALEGVTEKMRIVHSRSGYDPTIPNDARVFDILAVLPDEVFRDDMMIKAELLPRDYGTA